MRFQHFFCAASMLALSSAAQAQIDPLFTPFAGVRAKGDSDFEAKSRLGSLQVRVDFRLGAKSNGIDPLSEPITLEIEPNPANNPTEGGVHPCWFVVIPPGCFISGNAGFDVIDPKCGVQVYAVDEATQTQTDLLPYVTDFLASIQLKQGQGSARFEIDFLGLNPNTGIAPCWLSFRVGDDAVIRLSLDSRQSFTGRI